MGISKKKEKEARLKNLQALIDAYADVFADLESSVGFKKRSMDKALSVLSTRMWELETIWLPDAQDELDEAYGRNES